MLLHIGTFQLDQDSHHLTLWHRLAPQIRLLCALLFVFFTSFTPNGHWETWKIYGLGLILLILASKVSLSVLLQRVAIESAFIGVVLLGTLFRDGGEILWQWGWFRITTEGVTVLGSVSFKAILCLLMLNLLVLTTPITQLLSALTILKTPPLLVAILSSMYRYLGLLIEEAETMRRAALSRNLMNNAQWQRLIIGNTIGLLFIRTYQRGERVYQAMLARGYQGVPMITQSPTLAPRDWLALSLMVALLLLGQGIYLLFEN
ncbi:MAG: cobalt ECF transporter T component CbiQ [Snowella sp.]|nr:cobalt ECF transporter T component CbiQ [Snowella sp.]